MQSVGGDGTVWAKEAGSGRKRQRTVRLPAEYVAEHTHLAYASTAYGVQGATVPASHTVLGDALDGSGVYVGMTRGREANRLHVVAVDLDDAREQFVLALERDRADRGLVAATQAAREAVAGLAVDGPVLLVNTERARLTQRIEHADQQAEKWERAVSALARQRDAHRAEQTGQQEAAVAADARAAEVRVEVAAPLIEQATADGTAYLAARNRMWDVAAARAGAGRLRKRAAERAVTEAAGTHRATEGAVRRRWGGVPTGAASVQPWAEALAGKQADTDPRVADARRNVEQTHSEERRLAERRLTEYAALLRQVLGSATPSVASTRAVQWRTRAEQARRDLAETEALPVTEAAQLVRDRAARAEAERIVAERAQAARDARAAQLGHFRPTSTDRTRPGPERDGIGM